MNCTGFMVTMFVFLLYYLFLFNFITIQCLPFVANKHVHNHELLKDE